MSEIEKVVIIGSGPAGLTAAIYASRAQLNPLVIAGQKPGGQLMDTTEVENFPGFIDGIMGPALMQNMTEQSKKFGTRIVTESVQSVDFSSKPLKIKTENAEYLAHSVILAMGADANWLGLTNEQRLRGHGVSACATCDGFFFRGKELAVVGGGDAAMEEAIFLTKFATKVTLLNRSEAFKASKIMLDRAAANSKIAIEKNVQVVDVLGQDKVEGVRLKDIVTGEERDFKTDGLFLAIGHSPNSKIVSDQIEIGNKGYIAVKDNTRTNIEGVFVAGDVNDWRYRQAVTAAGMGCMAALDVERYLTQLGLAE